jgi:AcrR family transcriptional regulator
MAAMARPREFDERAVLRAAAGVFRRHGYAGASVEALTAATGLGKGSLYGAFGSKHGLYLAALDLYAGENVGATRRMLEESAGSPIQDLREYLGTIAAGSSNGSPSCLLTSATAELSDHDQPVAGRVKAAFDDLSASLRQTAELAQADGEIAPDADPEAVADLLLALARGIEVLGHAGMSRERLARAVDATVTAIAAG